MNYIDAIAETIQHLTDEDEMGPTRPLYRFYALLCLAKGTAVTDADVHNAWVAWRVATMPGHPSCVPFAALTPEAQALDRPETEAIRCAAAEWARQGGTA